MYRKINKKKIKFNEFLYSMFVTTYYNKFFNKSKISNIFLIINTKYKILLIIFLVMFILIYIKGTKNKIVKESLNSNDKPNNNNCCNIKIEANSHSNNRLENIGNNARMLSAEVACNNEQLVECNS